MERWRPTPAGMMNQRIRIDADITGEQNTLGEVVRNVQPIDEVWARVEPLGGTKAVGGDQPQALLTYLITTRFHPALVAARSLLYRGKRFEITRVVDVHERHAELSIIAKEQGSA